MVVKQEPSDPPPGHAPPEPVDPVHLEERILTLCAATPKGITDEMITQDQPFFDAEKRRAALQRLLSQVGSLYSLKRDGHTSAHPLTVHPLRSSSHCTPPPLTLTLYTPSAHPHTVHPLHSSSHCTPTALTLYTLTLYTHCTHTVHPLHSYCAPTALILYTLTLYTHCTHTVHPPPLILYTHCTYHSHFSAPLIPSSHFLTQATYPHSLYTPSLDLPSTSSSPPRPCTVGENRGPQAGLNTALQTEGDHLHHKVTMATFDHMYSVAQLSSLVTRLQLKGKNH